MAQARIASRPPVACAGCYGQYPERTHIDFASALEGAPIHSGPRAPRVDWVILCENCVRSAHNLLPFQVNTQAQHERTIAQLKERVESAENYASRLEDALAHRPDVDVAPEPRTPRKPQAASSGGRRNRYARDAA